MDNDDARHRRLVELNVIEQCVNIFKTGAVQKRRLETYNGNDAYTNPRIHAMVYDPATGLLNQLPVDFKQVLNELRAVYEFEDLAPYVEPTG